MLDVRGDLSPRKSLSVMSSRPHLVGAGDMSEWRSTGARAIDMMRNRKPG